MTRFDIANIFVSIAVRWRMRQCHDGGARCPSFAPFAVDSVQVSRTPALLWRRLVLDLDKHLGIWYPSRGCTIAVTAVQHHSALVHSSICRYEPLRHFQYYVTGLCRYAVMFHLVSWCYAPWLDQCITGCHRLDGSHVLGSFRLASRLIMELFLIIFFRCSQWYTEQVRWMFVEHRTSVTIPVWWRFSICFSILSVQRMVRFRCVGCGSPSACFEYLIDNHWLTIILFPIVATVVHLSPFP